ncbi:MAG TPA: NAD(P)/FAD-dependent oxidoreductase [Candidatus Limnocylindrales bacterium]|nr:NAD(P)/FAD-dependent oxidoreductase [Candidatus Limnocylindrales bacterium]
MSGQQTLPRSARHRVLIVGGGFGGLYAARELGKDDRLAVTIVDRRNHHLFAPLLYQVATGALSPGEIAQPLRSVLRKQENTTVLLGEAKGLDPERRELRLDDGATLAYDTLIVATGAHHSYFGHDDWERIAPGLKSIDDATEIRRKILIAFEAAEREHDPERRAEWLTFVIVGGGPTGVELAGALGEIARDTLRRDFRSIDPSRARILLIEGMERVLATYPPGRSRSAHRQLERLGVTVRLNERVVDLDERSVTTEQPDGTRDQVRAGTILWAAGVLASSFARVVADATGAATDRTGHLRVGPDLTLPGRPEIFAVGDAALQPWKPEKAVPGVAQGAIQSGTYAAKTIRARLDGRAMKPFHYRNRGDVAVIGRLAGVTDIPWLGPFGRQSGFAAWALWLGIHIVYLIGFANRIVVTTRWAWSFLTHGRGSRLITGTPLLPPIEDPAPPPSADPEGPPPAPEGDALAVGDEVGEPR